MKRKIIDINKLTDDLKLLFLDQYPEGYSVNDLISFRNGNGLNVDAIELKTDDTIYLIKINNESIPELEAISDEAYDYFLTAKQNDAELSMDSDNHEDVSELEDELQDDSGDFFSDLGE